MPAPAPLLIADVPWLLYRSYFALPKSITDGEGRPVNALLGTVNALLGALEPSPHTEAPRALAACMGAEEAVYRVRLYPGYHAHREPMPEELRRQWELAPELLEGLGWTFATDPELEADDVMFSFARAEQAAGGHALLLTGDRDLYGAVGERVAVVELSKGVVAGLIGPEGVRERYGVEPAQVPDLIALRGDPSDGLPGAPGVGAKTAAELLQAHGTLEGVIAAAGAVGRGAVPAAKPLTARIASAIAEAAAMLEDFKRIATLQSVPVALPGEQPTDHRGGAAVAARLGMRRLAERLGQLAGRDGLTA
jgi:DNA polymerase-1